MQVEDEAETDWKKVQAIKGQKEIQGDAPAATHQSSRRENLEPSDIRRLPLFACQFVSAFDEEGNINYQNDENDHGRDGVVED